MAPSALNGDIMSKKAYFRILGYAHILVYYPIIYYQRIEVYRVEKYIWEGSAGTMVSVKNATPVRTTVLMVWGKIFC